MRWWWSFCLRTGTGNYELCRGKKSESGFRSFFSGKELLEDIEKSGVCDLLFLDIELGDYTGVEVGKKIRSDIRYESMQIVFVSAKDNYAMQLFDIRPMNFLVKPVKYERVAYILEEYGRLFQF